MKQPDPYHHNWQARPLKDWDRKPKFFDLEEALGEMFIPMGRALRSRLSRVVANTHHLPAGKTRTAFIKLVHELKAVIDALDVEFKEKASDCNHSPRTTTKTLER